MKPIANYQLGDFLVNPVESTIHFKSDGGAATGVETKKSLQPKFVEVLTYLAQQYPRLVGREELIEKIWQDNQPVGEKALTNAIWHLRKNLKNDDAEVIETIRKVGYRLKIEPVWIEDEQALKTQAVDEPVRLDGVKPKLKSRWQLPSFIVGLVSVLLLFIWLQLNNGSNVVAPRLSKPQITQLTTSPGSELFVSASPDGHYIAYRWRQADGSVNLYLQDTHQLQAKPVQLTFDDLRQGHSVFSPDGQYLYFARKSVSRGICEMIKMSIASLKQQVMANCPVSGGYNYLDISPDGKTLAFQYSEGDEPSGIYFLSVGDSQASMGKARLRRFSCEQGCDYRDRDMAFSPDGQTLAVSRRFNRFNENIYLVDVSSGQAYELTQDHEDIVGLAWHPNGRQLVFATQVADVRRGFVIDVESKIQSSLDIDGFSYPAFAKKTGELFFQQRQEHYFVASLALDTSVASAPFPLVQSQFNHHYPDYSKAAERLVYVSNESGFYELWLADANGSERTQLTDMKTSIRYPRWSHDGSRIAFLAPVVVKGMAKNAGKAGDRIHIIDVNSGQVTVVDSPFITHNLPTWRLDDSAVICAVYDNDFTDLYQFDIATGKASRLTFDGGRFGVESSKYGLVYTKVSDGLWHKGFNDSGVGELLLGGDSFNSRYSWRLTDSGVYYQHHGGEYQQLMYADFATGQEHALLRMARYSLKDDGALSVSKVKNKLFFTQAHHPQADIQKVEHPLLGFD